MEWVGKEKQIRKEGKKEREARRTRKQKKGRWQKEKDIYFKKRNHGYSLPFVTPSQRQEVILKTFGREAILASFVFKKENSWNTRIMEL